MYNAWSDRPTHVSRSRRSSSNRCRLMDVDARFQHSGGSHCLFGPLRRVGLTHIRKLMYAIHVPLHIFVGNICQVPAFNGSVDCETWRTVHRVQRLGGSGIYLSKIHSGSKRTFYSIKLPQYFALAFTKLVFWLKQMFVHAIITKLVK